MKKVIGIDLDGTICTERTGTLEEIFEHRKEAKIIPGTLKFLKWLKKNGYYIIIYTGRNSTWYNFTLDFLIKNKIPFNELICAKPIFKHYIGNEAIRFENNWADIKNLIKIKDQE